MIEIVPTQSEDLLELRITAPVTADDYKTTLIPALDAAIARSERVRMLATGVLILEKVSELLGQDLQIGKGGIREGIVLDMLNGGIDVSEPALTPG